MNPNDIQCSINCPFNDNTVGCSGPTLPRSFTLADHGMRVYGPFSGRLIAHRGPNPSQREDGLRRPSKTFPGSTFTFYRPILGLSIVCGNSRATVVSRVPGRETRTVRHGIQALKTFSVLSIVLSPSKLFTCIRLFSLANVEGISRALFRSIIRVNQTRILFAWDSAQGLFWGFIAAHPSRLKLNVPYTVITGTNAHR